MALVDDKNEYTPIATSTYVSPNNTVEILSCDNNALKLLRGKRIAIKVKGSKKIIGGNDISVNTPYGSVGVHHQNIDPEILNNLSDEDVVYDFDANFSEANHDLYIKIIYTGKGKSIMDF